MASIAVIGVTIFILFVISSQWILIYHPLNFFGNIWGQSYIIIYHLISLLLLRCYWLSIINKPGSPDANWLPEGKTQQDLNILVEQFKDKSKILGNNGSGSSSGNGFSNFGGKGKSTTVLVDDDLSTITVVNSKNNSNNKKARFCSQCCVFKPPRTHHCKQCKKCVLKHDHHCPWIDNCTGFRNQKFFYQFLFYVVVLCTITILTLTISGFYILNVNLDPNIEKSNTKQINQEIIIEESDEIQFLIHSSIITILYVFNFSGVTPVLLGVSGLFFYQTEFLLGNYTPVERRERKKEFKTAKKNGMKYSWKYDHGWKQNFKQVMGDSIIQWFLPIGIPKTDGTYWKENEQYIQQQRILNSNSISNHNNTNNSFNNNNSNNNEHMDKQPLLNGANYDNDEIELNDFINKSSNSNNNGSNQPHHTQEKTRFGLVENV